MIIFLNNLSILYLGDCMDNWKFINIDIFYKFNMDNVTNLGKYALTKPHFKLVLFN